VSFLYYYFELTYITGHSFTYMKSKWDTHPVLKWGLNDVIYMISV